MNRLSLRSCVLIVAFLAMAGWLAATYIDLRLAARSQQQIDRAYMGYLQQAGSGDERWRWQSLSVKADVCKALVGNLGWRWLLRRSGNLDWPDVLVASVEGGQCDRGANNRVIFTPAENR